MPGHASTTRARRAIPPSARDQEQVPEEGLASDSVRLTPRRERRQGSGLPRHRALKLESVPLIGQIREDEDGV